MTNWFDDVIKECCAEEEPKQDFNKMKEALSSLGFDVSSINITSIENKEDNIGKRACVKESIVIASNVLIKTNYNLYRVAKVELPKGYIGVIDGVEDGKYSVNFDANLKIASEDIVAGYDGSEVTYPLDKFILSDKEVQIL